MSFLNKILKGFLGNKNERDVREAEKYLQKIKELEPVIGALSHDELRSKTSGFKDHLLKRTQKISNEIDSLQTQVQAEEDVSQKEILYEAIDARKKECYEVHQGVLLEILPEAFAVIKETAKRFNEYSKIAVKATSFDRDLSSRKEYVSLQQDRAIWKNSWNTAGKPTVWNMVHYDVQLIGGTVLHQGKIAEMATGEGKTLAATLPIYLNALTSRGVHVVTVNDYLAKRDAAWMAPIMEFHGLSVDCIDEHLPNTPMRRQAYAADITYGTNNEFGFDYLRDNMARSADEIVQRELNYAIVDEVDSVLIDDARTPLIISGPVPQGDRQEFDVLKPKLERIVQQQRLELGKTLTQARELIKAGDKKTGGFKILQVHRGLPKNKTLIKFLSEENNRVLLQKTEGKYMQDNNREMPKVDAHLYFVIDEKNKTIELTDKGIDFLSKDVSDSHFFILRDIVTEIAELESTNLPKEEEDKKKETLLKEFSIKSARLHTLNQLLKAYTLFEKDIDYVVIDGQVKIVDEQTGRIMDGRRYSDGLHQAIEAKENVKIEAASQTFATITLQNYFRMYSKLAGMTGTAETEVGEFWQIYKLDVVSIPTNQAVNRKDHQDLVFKTKREKYNALISKILKLSQEEKRPVLVGTTSVEVSELLSRTLKLRKISHNVLNAKLHKKEADIIAEAGSAGVVTIATNMAGRGTDIKLSDEAKIAGGLAILGTERHDSRRVDRQLRGRSGRQGDPGSSQFFVSLQDGLMRLFGSDRLSRVMDRLGHKEGDVIQHSLVTRSIERAQKKVEENNFGIRKRLLEYDDVINKQREVIYKKRRNALLGERLSIDIATVLYNTVQSLISDNKEINDFKNFQYEWVRYFAIETSISSEDFSSLKEQELTDSLYKSVIEVYKLKKEHLEERVFPIITNVYQSQRDRFERIQIPFTDGIKSMLIIVNLKNAYESSGKSLIYEFERSVILAIIDEKWKEHLREMDELRSSVQNAVYEQKEPLLIYKGEAFNLFHKTMSEINRETVSFLFKANLLLEDQKIEKSLDCLKKAPDLRLERNYHDHQLDSSDQNLILESVMPRQAGKKTGRNDRIHIRHMATGEVRHMKFKQAEALIEKGEWILEKES
ncbi:preprotein translocase subunit SecA [Bacteroidetes bacterium endosymbiont of Geopemphigus sp.]|uniref:preprotein translocase subunit SecA n=1 Tax=Bacteroidetes bacterium endosymbiont of Geopemphigus sp. TaxID=2047937 RepID=UPI000CD0C1F4|nr:preprotein translocase subunit SecA [Bacteroidetes bacterium endosymbiont of Geopemphigus sp.]